DVTVATDGGRGAIERGTHREATAADDRAISLAQGAMADNALVVVDHLPPRQHVLGRLERVRQRGSRRVELRLAEWRRRGGTRTGDRDSPDRRMEGQVLGLEGPG